MGFLRFSLAASVVFAHCNVFFITTAQISVQLFFLISGFLISFILSKSGRYPSYRNFFLSRVLRLFPLYWICLVVTAIMFVVHFMVGLDSSLIQLYSQLDFAYVVLLVLANIFVIGQDLIMFTVVDGEALSWSKTFRTGGIETWKGLLLPQAWTLSLELYFYLLAPALVKLRSSALITILVVIFGVRSLFISLGYDFDPWVYRFFPFEGFLFVAGVLSFRTLNFWRSVILAKLAYSLWVTVAGLLLLLYLISLVSPAYSFFLVGLIGFPVIPLLFNLSEHNRFDAVIGRYSFPLYISHFSLIYPTHFVFELLGLKAMGLLFGIVVFIFSFLVSTVWVFKFEQKIEIIRSKLKC